MLVEMPKPNKSIGERNRRIIMQKHKLENTFQIETAGFVFNSGDTMVAFHWVDDKLLPIKLVNNLYKAGEYVEGSYEVEGFDKNGVYVNGTITPKTIPQVADAQAGKYYFANCLVVDKNDNIKSIMGMYPEQFVSDSYGNEIVGPVQPKIDFDATKDNYNPAGILTDFSRAFAHAEVIDTFFRTGQPKTNVEEPKIEDENIDEQ